MGTTIRANVFLYVVMTRLTEVGISIYLRTAMGACGTTDRLSTLGAEHRFKFIDGSTVRAWLTGSLTVCHLGLLLMILPFFL
jgi:hypothetical protein